MWCQSVLECVSFFFCASVNINPLYSIPYTVRSGDISWRIFFPVWLTIVSTFGVAVGDCFRTWVPCSHFPFLLQFNERLLCCNACLWEDFCSGCSSPTWSSGWRRRLLGLVDPAADWHGWPGHIQNCSHFFPPVVGMTDRLGDKPSPAFLSPQHFTEFLDEFSPDVLGQLLNDPFLSEKNEIMEVELSPASPAPLIQAEHSYSLCGDSRPQSPLTHISTDDNFNEGTAHWALVHLLWWCSNEMLLVELWLGKIVMHRNWWKPIAFLTATCNSAVINIWRGKRGRARMVGGGDPTFLFWCEVVGGGARPWISGNYKK